MYALGRSRSSFDAFLNKGLCRLARASATNDKKGKGYRWIPEAVPQRINVFRFLPQYQKSQEQTSFEYFFSFV